MIKIEKVDIFGWDAAIRGMRNPKNSWEKSDSHWTHIEDAQTMETAKFQFFLGKDDLALMQTLAGAGPDHGKFARFINVTCDITAPLYWWKEFDTYKVGTVANSCSTMHKIAARPFTPDDFSHEHMTPQALSGLECSVIPLLNGYRKHFNESHRKEDWWQLIQLLPSSYNQKRTVQLNYEVLHAMNRNGRRRDHKLDEWKNFCKWVDTLPYFVDIFESNTNEERRFINGIIKEVLKGGLESAT